jgi:di/tricarboxylate transporter
MPQLLRSFLHDSVLHLLIVIGVVLAFLADFRWADLPGAVDWHTIITLTGLLILTKGLETSGFATHAIAKVTKHGGANRTVELRA